MDWRILPQDRTADRLEVHLTLDRPYPPIHDALEASFFVDPSCRLVSTQDDPGNHRFEVRPENSDFCQTLIKLFDDPTPRTEVVIQNRRSYDPHGGRALKAMTIEVTRRLCAQFNDRGYVPESDCAEIATALESYRPH